MRKVWVLDTETKGTGAEMVPLEKVLEERPPESGPVEASRRRTPAAAASRPARAPRQRKTDRLPAESRAPRQGVKTSGPLPAGHVRKKTTGEIGRVESVDAKAGTANVLWLRQGRSSVVPLTAISRR
jgi:hypothetical protein